MEAGEVGLKGLVGGVSWTVAFGKLAAGAPPPSGVFAVLRGIVGAPIGAEEVANLMVGAPAAVGGPAVRRGMVGAGAGGFGAVGATGAEAVGGIGGLTGAVGADAGTVAEGTAGGASAALRVTLTVSFFKGTLEVCFDGAGFSFSFSLIGGVVLSLSH